MNGKDRSRDEQDAGYGAFAAEADALQPLEREQPLELEPKDPDGSDDPIGKLLARIDVAPDRLQAGLQDIWASGYDCARRALLGSAATADEFHVLGWACALTAHKEQEMAKSWREAGDALRAAQTATGTDEAKERAAATLKLVIQAAHLKGIGIEP